MRRTDQTRITLTTCVELIVEHVGRDDAQRMVARDLSEQGCSFTMGCATVRVDDAIIVTWAHGQAGARVRWTEVDSFGVSFDESSIDTKSLLLADVS